MARRFVPIAGLVLSGCMAQPDSRPLPAEAYENSTTPAYLWSAGMSEEPLLSMQDYAVLTRIDGVDVPSRFIPTAGFAPGAAWRFEIPAGSHVVEVLNKETRICLPGYLGPMCFVTERLRRSITFTAQSGRTYTPVVDEKCSKKWFRIVDSGPIDQSGPQSKFLAVEPGSSAVAGGSPPDASCADTNREQSE